MFACSRRAGDAAADAAENTVESGHRNDRSGEQSRWMP